jgi:hypothetical protein
MQATRLSFNCIYRHVKVYSQFPVISSILLTVAIFNILQFQRPLREKGDLPRGD